jgi:DNA-directed RNA polymerase subunit H (RpoH/RPB5)
MFTQVLCELLETRNYTNIVFSGAEGSPRPWGAEAPLAAKDTVDDSKYLLCTCLSTSGTPVCIFGVFNEPKLNVHSVKECLLICEEFQCVHCIIVYLDVVTPVVKKLVANMNVRIELFRKKELGYNITKHAFVPKHKLATVEERKALTKYITNIPQIKSTDAVVRFMGFKVGDIVHISRHDGSVVFRIVV